MPSMRYSLLVIGISLLLAGCVQPVVTPTATSVPTALPQAIVIDAPLPGAVVSSPLVVRGATARVPPNNQLNYRLTDGAGVVLASGSLPVLGAEDGPGRFDGTITFQVGSSGTARLEVLQQSPVDGSVRAAAIVPVGLTTGYPAPATTGPTTPSPLPATALPSTALPSQIIVIETPAPGTQVGSPMTITGRTSQAPYQAALGYRVFDSSNRILGSGLIGVEPAGGQGYRFVAELYFELPASPAELRIDVFDQDSISQRVAGQQSLRVRYGSPSAPPPPTLLPSATAVPSLVIATATLPVATATSPAATQPPVPALITIDSPPFGSSVTSPANLAGRISSSPTSGQLRYRIRDAGGRVLGEGVLAVTGSAGQPGTFAALVGFSPPQQDPTVVIEVLDLDTSGAVRSSALVVVQIARSTPYPGP